LPAENIAGVYFTLPRIAQLALVELIVSQILMFVERRGGETPRHRGEEGVELIVSQILMFVERRGGETPRHRGEEGGDVSVVEQGLRDVTEPSS
jgi:hypothetical protein